MHDVPRATSAGGGRTSAPSAIILPFTPTCLGAAAATLPVTTAATAGHHRFTPADRADLIALGYALAGWEFAFEGDGQGMHWAALCPPGAANGAAGYLIGRDSGALVLLSVASGKILGRYAAGAALAQDVRRWEGPERGQQCAGVDLGPPCPASPVHAQAD